MPLPQITKVGAFTNDVADQINENFATLAGAAPAGALTDAHILVGDGDDLAQDVAVSGDATIDNTGAVTVVGVNGAAITATGTEIDAAIATVDAITATPEEIDAAGAYVAALTATTEEVDAAAAAIAALPTMNVAAPAIWNDAGTLKVGTA